MAEVNPNGSSPNTQPAAPVPQRRRTPKPFIILAVLFVVVPFLTWYLTWFGRSLSDDDITRYLADEKNVRHVQQALTQVEERIEKGDAGAKRWYPQIVVLARSQMTEIRKTAAWVMGQDNRAEEFHAALRGLLADPQPVVRRNAAVQLVRFGDADGRAELRATLQPYEVRAASGGKVASVLKEGGDARENVLVARIVGPDGSGQELRSPLPGKIISVSARDGTEIKAGDVILVLGPDPDFVYEALRALFFVGEAEDLPLVEQYERGAAEMPERVKEQAAQTARAIRGRSEKKGPSESK